MGTCKECKWWGTEYERKHNGPDEHRGCMNVRVNPPEGSARDGVAEDTHYTCCPGPDFGCIHFEASHPAIDIGKDAR